MAGIAHGLKLTRGVARLSAVVTAGLMMSGCAGLGDAIPSMSSLPSIMGDAKPEAPSDEPKVAQNELQKATEYWGNEYKQKPTDLNASLNYARNLKALGQKRQALEILQQASLFHSGDRKLNSEYGRLALEFDQVSAAEKLLAAADDPTSPDWRVISARGTVLAKQARYKEAIPFYERALELSPDQPSVMNNLALAYAMSGEAARAEDILRKTNQSGGGTAKVRQNLALVLGLQGKYDEATKVGSEVAPSATAAANTDLLKQMVKLEAKPFAPIPEPTWDPVVTGPALAAKPKAEPAAWQTKVATASKPAPAKAQATPPAQPAADTASPPAALRLSTN